MQQVMRRLRICGQPRREERKDDQESQICLSGGVFDCRNNLTQASVSTQKKDQAHQSH